MVYTTFHLTMIWVVCSKDNASLIYNPKTFEIILIYPTDMFSKSYYKHKDNFRKSSLFPRAFSIHEFF